jgi:hypothetical protein
MFVLLPLEAVVGQVTACERATGRSFGMSEASVIKEQTGSGSEE